jgi:polar amino acid transport system substrate-binding protein
MDDEPVLQYAIKQGVNAQVAFDGIDSGEFGFAVKKGHNSELLAKFNSGLHKLKENGELDKIVGKYISK